jgi:hypothetical protein
MLFLKYRAVIVDPDRNSPRPDKFGTLHQSPAPSTASNSLEAVVEWASLILKGETAIKTGPDAHCDIFEMRETHLDTISRNSKGEIVTRFSNVRLPQ